MQQSNPALSGRRVLGISGMTCASCARTVERVLSRVPGVARAVVDLSTGRAVVEGAASTADLVAAIEAAGYGARALNDNASGGASNERRRAGCCCG